MTADGGSPWISPIDPTRLTTLLPNRLYADAVSLISWIRLGYAQRIRDRLASANAILRIEEVIVQEVEAGLHSPLALAMLDSIIDSPQVERVELAAEDPNVYARALILRRRITDIESAANPSGRPKRSANLGEAVIIARIVAGDPDALFVTADIGAVRVAQAAGVRIARPYAFVGLEVALGSLTMEKVWSDLCDTRSCDQDSRQCKSDLRCPHLDRDASDRGVLRSIESETRLRRLVSSDMNELARALGL